MYNLKGTDWGQNTTTQNIHSV